MRRRRLVHPRSLVAALVGVALFAGCSPSTDVESLKADAVEPGDDDRDDTEPDDTDDRDPDDTDPDRDDPAADDPGTLDWTRCEASSPLMAGFQCATLAVPLDHAEPTGEQIELALVRSPATGNDRIGSLVFNPGGPGGSGIEFLSAAAGLLPYDIVGRFDLVSFDPRGVGASTAIDCDFDLDDTKTLEEGDDAGWAELVADAEASLDECTPATAALAPYVGTNNAARDLDLIREALGDEQLSYVGYSYGTRLGAVYAELFPERVRALVLDGAVKPTSDLAELEAGQGPAFDNAFERFAAACDGDEDCPLADVGATEVVYDDLRRALSGGATMPTADSDRTLNLGELELAVAAALYSTETWPILALGLAEAADGDASILQALVDGYVGRRPDGTYDDSQAAGGVINCADDAVRPSVDEVRLTSEVIAAGSLWFHEFLRADTGCIGLPEAIDPVAFGPADGAAPILVIGTTNDPATPYEWSVELAELLDSGVLFTVEGDGHTAFLSIDCVEDVVVDYLVDLELPDGEGGDASCADDSGTEEFPPAGESEFDQVLALFDCLRDHGADIPEITLSDLIADPSGESLLEVLDPTDPAFVEAALECQDVIGDL